MGAHSVTEEPIQSVGRSSGGGLESHCESAMEHPSADGQQQQRQGRQQQQQQGGHCCQANNCGEGVSTVAGAECNSASSTDLSLLPSADLSSSSSPGLDEGQLDVRAAGLIGEWKAQHGIFIVSDGGPRGLLFEEPEMQLYGQLQAQESWHTAEIHDRKHDDAIFGYLRLQREGKYMHSKFTYSLSTPWSNPGLWAQRLPYADVFTVSISPNDARNEMDADCCPICLDDFKVGETAATLICNHMYHRACIRHWFSQHASCPLRCLEAC